MKHPALEHLVKVGAVICDPATDPRTVAILAAGYLERYLTDVIVSHLPGLNSDLRTRMFTPSMGPLGDLGSKIDFTKALGAIDAQIRQDCIGIARVRNRFAHNIDIDSFDHPEIDKLCQDLSWKHPLRMEGCPEPDISTPRGKFVSTAIGVCALLSNALNPNARGSSPAK